MMQEGGSIVDVATRPGPDTIQSLSIDLFEMRVYYSYAGSGLNPTNSIESVRLDGTDLQEVYVTASHSPRGVAVAPWQGRLFWVELGTPARVQRVNTDGSTLVSVHDFGPGRNPRPVVLDKLHDKLYVGDVETPPHIERMDLDGSNVELIYSRPPAVTGGAEYLDVDASGGHLYWIESYGGSTDSDHEIRRSALDGTLVETVLFLPGAQERTPRGIAVDPVGGRIYWTESDFCGVTPTSGRIRSARLDGTDVRTDVTGLAVLTDIKLMR